MAHLSRSLKNCVQLSIFRCVLASRYERVSVRRMDGRMVGWMVGPCVTRFFQTPKMSCFLYENHWGSPTLTLLNVLGVLGVLNVLHVLKCASCASCALFYLFRHALTTPLSQVFTNTHGVLLSRSQKLLL